MKDRIIEMLGNNVPPSVIAKAVGCDPSYISQIMNDEGIAAEVAEARMKDLDRSMKVDDSIEELEEMALQKMKQLMPFISRPLDAARMFQVANGAKKRTAEVVGLQVPTAPLVSITISPQAAVAFKLSADQQVVEVDGRSLTTLPTKQLNAALKTRQESRAAITDVGSAKQLIENIENGIPVHSLAHVL